MAVELAPIARSQFAKRLKAIRTQRGFERARYFAESLGIEENRYTRYERAEVEPSLTLLHKICATLHVSPDQLLGFADLELDDSSTPMSAFAESAADGLSSGAGFAGPVKAEPRSSLAWRVAAEVEAIHRETFPKSGSSADTFTRMRDTSTLYQSLQSDPFGTVAKILADPALEAAGADRRAALAELIEAFTRSVT